MVAAPFCFGTLSGKTDSEIPQIKTKNTVVNSIYSGYNIITGK